MNETADDPADVDATAVGDVVCANIAVVDEIFMIIMRPRRTTHSARLSNYAQWKLHGS